MPRRYQLNLVQVVFDYVRQMLDFIKINYYKKYLQLYQ